MIFGLYNALAKFQRCMISIFSEIVKDSLEVFMDKFSVVGDSCDSFLMKLNNTYATLWELNLVLN